ncbi:MAG: HAMP domain-containing protein [Rhodobacteraceae bacterium]|nr:HAMP domain-containing protein [Paracoccaceae bacterium]
MLENLSAGRKILLAFAAFASVAGSGTAIVLVLLVIITQSGVGLGQRLTPLNAAVMEMQLSAAAGVRAANAAFTGNGSVTARLTVASRLSSAQAEAERLRDGIAAAGRTLPADTAAALGEATDTVLTRIGALREATDAALARDAEPATIHTVDKAYNQFVSDARATQRVVNDAIAASVAHLQASRNIALGIMAAAAIGLCSAMFFSWRWLERALGRRLRDLATVMRRLIAGDLEAEPPAWHSGDEVGVLRESVSGLRDALRRQKQLEAESRVERQRAEAERADAQQARARAEEQSREATEQRALSERQREEAVARAEATGRFVEEFGTVVSRAAEGRFDGSIASRFEDPALAELARGMNRLVEEVDRGIGETMRSVSRLAEGDLTDMMEGDFAGAFADLKRDVNGTVDTLRRIVADITGTTEAIVRDTHRISENSGALAQRANAQADALRETSATMTGLAATVRANSESAEKVAGRIREAAATATNGGSVVNDAVAAMSQIDASARQVTEIIEVLNDISFQTNLLALNAGVEAARAGEAGRGFAVVASEVRALAQRAGEAAENIRGLIAKSSLDVAEGVRLVTDTGTFLQDIVRAIEDVAATTDEISEASHSQTLGIEEVTSAISEMDALTSQNASMAEESASSARTLTELSERLEDLVRFFRTDRTARTSAPARNRSAA